MRVSSPWNSYWRHGEQQWDLSWSHRCYNAPSDVFVSQLFDYQTHNGIRNGVSIAELILGGTSTSKLQIQSMGSGMRNVGLVYVLFHLFYRIMQFWFWFSDVPNRERKKEKWKFMQHEIQVELQLRIVNIYVTFDLHMEERYRQQKYVSVLSQHFFSTCEFLLLISFSECNSYVGIGLEWIDIEPTIYRLKQRS